MECTCRCRATRSVGRSGVRATSIAYNGRAGVAVVDEFNGPTTGVAILSNSIYANQDLGIDLNDDGVTPNHPGGPIPGPNNYQNFPVLTSAVSSGGKIAIVGTLNSAASTSYLIQFFANVTADPSGYGQGQTYLGQITVTTDANGNASFTAKFSTSVPAGQFISATATRPQRRHLRVRPGRDGHEQHLGGCIGGDGDGPCCIASFHRPDRRAVGRREGVPRDQGRRRERFGPGGSGSRPDRRPETADGRPRCDEESPSDDLMSQRYEFGRSVCVPTLECRPRPIPMRSHRATQRNENTASSTRRQDTAQHPGAWQEPRLLKVAREAAFVALQRAAGLRPIS